MMFFALAGKCVGFGAIGLTDAEGAAPKSSCSLSNDASAMPPSPSPQRLKNCRRVRKRRSGCVGKWLMVEVPNYPSTQIPKCARLFPAWVLGCLGIWPFVSFVEDRTED